MENIFSQKAVEMILNEWAKYYEKRTQQSMNLYDTINDENNNDNTILLQAPCQTKTAWI